MKKKTPLFLLIISFLLLVPYVSYASTGDGSSQPVNYVTQIKVKLLPTETFSITINGTYEIVNLDTNKIIPSTPLVSFKQSSGKVNMTVDGTTHSSSKGFTINEITLNESNYVEISKINSAYGLTNVQYRGSFDIIPGEKSPSLFNRLDMENYLKGVVPSEMPSSWPKEALKAQTVAARSYAYAQLKSSKKGYLEMTVASQVYGGKSKEAASTNQAILETSGMYATYNNVPISAFFHSSSGGYTENSENVWSSVVPYIRSVEDPFDKHPGNYHYGWEFIGQASTIKDKLSLNDQQLLIGLRVSVRGTSNAVKQMSAIVYDKTTKTKSNVDLFPALVTSPDRYRSFFGISLKSIKFDVKSDAGAKIMLADGTEKSTDHLTGYKIQKADGTTSSIEDLNIPVKTISSTSIVRALPTTFTFKGDGWGHSLGMSQWGARGMADAGYTYDQILKHYYTDIEVKKIQ